mgnify:CR=1 FL=1
MVLIKTSAASITPAWEIEETGLYSTYGAGLNLFGRLPKGWLLTAGFDGPRPLRYGDHNLVFKSTQPAFLNGRLELASRVVLPAHLLLGLARPYADGKTFWTELHWTRFSRTKIDGRLVAQSGTGLLWDTDLFQRQVLGASYGNWPGYKNVLGLVFGFENRLTRNFRYFLGTQFWTHYADPRVVMPTLSLGLGLNNLRGFSWDMALAASRRDYFGDGLFWPKDQRLDETLYKLLTRLTFAGP